QLAGVAILIIFFFQAEDGIRDLTVTGVQTCALPILARLYLKPGRYEIRAASDVTGRSRSSVYGFVEVPDFAAEALAVSGIIFEEIGRASCRERVEIAGVDGVVEKRVESYG